MAGFNGRWRLVKQENLEAYHNQIKTPEDYKEKLRTVMKSTITDPNAYVEELHVDQAAGIVSRTVFVNGEKKRDTKIPIGVETETTGQDGRTFKGTLNIDSDTQFHVHEKGADFETNLIFALKGDHLEVTLTSGGVTAKQFYDRA